MDIFHKIEDTRTEFKEILNDKLEKKMVGFLNTNGGNVDVFCFKKVYVLNI